MRKSEEAKQRARDRANKWYRDNKDRAAANKRRNRLAKLDQYRGYTNQYKLTRRQAIASYKLKKGCAICGYRGHPDALHFDHLPDHQKIANISQIYRNAWEDVLREIEKCQVLCANCHAIQTAARHQEKIEKKRAEKKEQQMRLRLA